MAEGGYGGYDYEFVDKLDSKYYCLVCQNVPRDPMLTDCCGIHYCQSCLQQWRNSSSYTRQCTQCRKQNYRTMLNQPLKREINELKIYCVNRSSKRCLWEGELEKLPQHLCSSCPLREAPQRPTIKIAISNNENPESVVQCPNGCGKQTKKKKISEHRQKCPQEEVQCKLQGPNENNEVVACGRTMLRSELPRHEKICLFRQYRCKFCKEESTYAAITGNTKGDTKELKVPPEKGHYAECPAYPLQCGNMGCSKEMKRADMQQHAKECPFATIQCELWNEGCKKMVKRNEMKKHMNDYVKEHYDYVWVAYTQTKAQLAKVNAGIHKAQQTAEQETRQAKEELKKTTAALRKTTIERDSAKEESHRRTQKFSEKLFAVEKELVAATTELSAVKDDRSAAYRKLSKVQKGLSAEKDVRAATERKLSAAEAELQALKRKAAEQGCVIS